MDSEQFAKLMLDFTHKVLFSKKKKKKKKIEIPKK